MKTITSIFLFLLLLSLNGYATDKTKIWLLTYYDFPPFVVDDQSGKGLNHAFAELLNSYSEEFFFESKLYPKKRINHALKAGQNVMVGWVDLMFFGDSKRDKYFWSEALVAGENVLLSHVDHKVEFEGMESLRGLKFGGGLGRRYGSLDKLVQEGVLIREDAPLLANNIEKLYRKKIDITIMPKIVAGYLVHHSGYEQDIFISQKPILAFERRLLVPKTLPNLFNHMNELLKQSGLKKELAALLKTYYPGYQ